VREISAEELSVRAVDLWMNRWLLLTAGTLDDCNMMTVAWGSVGCMWSKPFVQVVVRPQRYTYGFMERSESFTVCAFPEEYRDALRTMGSISGRDGDKVSKTSLTFKASTGVAAPAYEQADLILECRKMYFQDMDPAGFVDEAIRKNYPKEDYHRIYFGEIVVVHLAE